jgi:hypothetical protein
LSLPFGRFCAARASGKIGCPLLSKTTAMTATDHAATASVHLPIGTSDGVVFDVVA